MGSGTWACHSWCIYKLNTELIVSVWPNLPIAGIQEVNKNVFKFSLSLSLLLIKTLKKKF